jgi:DNA-binding MarR family transcriptional regulator
LHAEDFDIEIIAWENRSMPRRDANSRKSVTDSYRRDVASYVAAGADEQVQRVVTAVQRLSKRLGQWYDNQLADLNVSSGEWAVLSELARSGGEAMTPSQLAVATDVAASSMTHRLDGLVERDLVERRADPENRTRVLVTLTDDGWEFFAEAIREANVVERDILAPLTDRQSGELADLLERLIEGLDESDSP